MAARIARLDPEQPFHPSFRPPREIEVKECAFIRTGFISRFAECSIGGHQPSQGFSGSYQELSYPTNWPAKRARTIALRTRRDTELDLRDLDDLFGIIVLSERAADVLAAHVLGYSEMLPVAITHNGVRVPGEWFQLAIGEIHEVVQAGLTPQRILGRGTLGTVVRADENVLDHQALPARDLPQITPFVPMVSNRLMRAMRRAKLTWRFVWQRCVAT